jgi:hypothetical protein
MCLRLTRQSHKRGAKRAGFHPFLKAIMGGGVGTPARGIQGVPLAASMQHVENRVSTLPI